MPFTPLIQRLTSSSLCLFSGSSSSSSSSAPFPHTQRPATTQRKKTKNQKADMSGLKSAVFFLFGPSAGSYILGTPRKVTHNNIPNAMTLQLSDIKLLRTAVLDEQGRWFMYFMTHDGDHTYSSSMSWNEQYDPGPHAWLARELSSCKAAWPVISASVGPDSSVFVCLPSGECAYTDSLPVNTEKAFKKAATGCHLAQGLNKTFVILYGRRKVSWLLKEEYPTLNSLLEKVTGRYSISFAALNPWHRDQFFIMVEDKIAFFQVDAAMHADVTDALSAAGIPANVISKDGSQGLAGLATASKKDLYDGIETALMGYNLVNLAGGLAPVTEAAGCLVM